LRLTETMNNDNDTETELGKERDIQTDGEVELRRNRNIETVRQSECCA